MMSDAEGWFQFNAFSAACIRSVIGIGIGEHVFHDVFAVCLWILEGPGSRRIAFDDDFAS
jgi:hypothetical protein